jgi:hypothetical protein
MSHQHLRDYRVVSTLSLAFNSYIMYDFLQWIQASPPETIASGVAITGIMASITMTYKLVFDFAMKSS